MSPFRTLFLGAAFVIATMATGAVQAATILVLGDSLTAGYGLKASDSFPSRLQAALRDVVPGVKVINGGVSGDTSAGGLARLDWLMQDKPDMIIVELGANDALRGIDPESTRKNLDGIIRRAMDRGVKVLLTGMLAPPNMGPDYGKAFNGIYAELAQRHKISFYPFFLEGVAAISHLNLNDGIHPNAKGVSVIVERILPTVLKALSGE